MLLALSALLALGLAQGCALNDPDPMTAQQRYGPWGYSPFFSDARTMRTPPKGTVPRTYLREKLLKNSGRTSDGRFVEVIPIPVTMELMERGRSRFEIYCAPCHGYLANGDSMVSRNMALRPPPALHPVMSTHPPGYIYTVITYGYGMMPSYESALTVDERWAVVAYLRALNRSQNKHLEDAPPKVRALLTQESPR